MLLNGKCEGKYRQVIYCCYLTVAESAGTPQLILNLKQQFYQNFLLDNNIQNVDTFHRHNLTAQCTRRSSRSGA